MDDTAVSNAGPGHVTFIADGNRRWARARGLSVTEGYRSGADRVTDVVGWCDEMGVRVVTVFLVSARIPEQMRDWFSTHLN
ncbi:undecaprenyl diphosphate synthase family protein [Streptomyces sp. NPDC051445]|uniref:undecaprenyl diphosphate synthase family protein n=1 Tax=Streptomyces sp. NPDC051445 TaxID=3365653 RepID=UPI0037922BE8